ncbi:siphovirus Gp157 family protein [Staphylococcus pseudintermedius]|nr:siphovirus Gp157 family protein [Staphylococcus pseudintermedius]EGQ4401236.1 siphovirus Gp157 family protein [Staphylococcus pseudintermedius]EGQ4488620.1 hypothetical protein [Staphylococcus pseudintermedius]EHT3695435.1 siphovirus Gp157 family protein [Staphylococcus pseudintermedius]ELH1910929.1 siphovirus Gp157 family protein [Staphylococcus pseudintermedius]
MEDMKLYDYTESYHNVLRFIDESEDLTYEDLKDTLDAIADGAEEKIANTGKVIQKLEDDLLVIKNRKGEIDNLRKKKEKQIIRLKEYLLHNMKELNKKKVETPTITVSTRNSKVLHIYDESKMPKEFIKEEFISKPDKEGFKKYLKSLSEEEVEKIDYAKLVTNQTLSIK